MNRFLSLFLTALLLILFSCNNDSRIMHEVKSMVGRKIIFPPGYQWIPANQAQKAEKYLQKDVKVITFIDNLSCTECGIRALNFWVAEMKKIDSDVAYIFVVQTKNRDELEMMADSVKLDIPFMLYLTDLFKTNNELDVLAHNKTFLLDKENKIVLVGEPFGNEKLTQLYKKAVFSLKEEYAHELTEQ